MSYVFLPNLPSFVGLFNEGSPIFNNNLDDLAQIPGIEYLIQVEYIAYNHRKFTLVNSDGKLRFLRIGDFEVRDISNEVYHIEHKADIALYDYRDDKIRKERIITGQRADFMMRELLNLLNDLLEAGSYLIYKKLCKLKEFEEENKRLKEQINILESKIK